MARAVAHVTQAREAPLRPLGRRGDGGQSERLMATVRFAPSPHRVRRRLSPHTKVREHGAVSCERGGLWSTSLLPAFMFPQGLPSAVEAGPRRPQGGLGVASYPGSPD